MPFAKVRGIEIYHEVHGNGPRVLFISGTGSDLRREPNVFDVPGIDRLTICAYDHRLMGQSTITEHDLTMDDFADDALALLDHLGWDDCAVVGVSFGGMVAQELAIRHPHAVEGLVLACTSPGGAGGASYPLHTLLGMDREERARHMIPISDTRHDEAWAKANPETYEQLVAFAANDPYTDEPGREMGARRQLEARADHDTWDRLGEIHCPTLICGGKYDGIALPETQEKMASRIRGAELRFFEGGHLFMLQDRTALPTMTSFLKGEDET